MRTVLFVFGVVVAVLVGAVEAVWRLTCTDARGRYWL